MYWIRCYIWSTQIQSNKKFVLSNDIFTCIWAPVETASLSHYARSMHSKVSYMHVPRLNPFYGVDKMRICYWHIVKLYFQWCDLLSLELTMFVNTITMTWYFGTCYSYTPFIPTFQIKYRIYNLHKELYHFLDSSTVVS